MPAKHETTLRSTGRPDQAAPPPSALHREQILFGGGGNRTLVQELFQPDTTSVASIPWLVKRFVPLLSTPRKAEDVLHAAVPCVVPSGYRVILPEDIPAAITQRRGIPARLRRSSMPGAQHRCWLLSRGRLFKGPADQPLLASMSTVVPVETRSPPCAVFLVVRLISDYLTASSSHLTRRTANSCPRSIDLLGKRLPPCLRAASSLLRSLRFRFSVSLYHETAFAERTAHPQFMSFLHV